MKQKQEIAQLKKAFQERSEHDMTSQMSEAVGQKRESSDDSQYKSQLESMQEKIQKLEQQIEERNKQVEDLMRNAEANNIGQEHSTLCQETKASSTEILNTEVTPKVNRPSTLGQIMDGKMIELQSEADDDLISRGTPAFNFSQELKFQRRTSQTPVNSPRKSLVMAKKDDEELIFEQSNQDICEEQD